MSDCLHSPLSTVQRPTINSKTPSILSQHGLLSLFQFKSTPGTSRDGAGGRVACKVPPRLGLPSADGRAAAAARAPVLAAYGQQLAYGGHAHLLPLSAGCHVLADAKPELQRPRQLLEPQRLKLPLRPPAPHRLSCRHRQRYRHCPRLQLSHFGLPLLCWERIACVLHDHPSLSLLPTPTPPPPPIPPRSAPPSSRAGSLAGSCLSPPLPPPMPSTSPLCAKRKSVDPLIKLENPVAHRASHIHTPSSSRPPPLRTRSLQRALAWHPSLRRAAQDPAHCCRARDCVGRSLEEGHRPDLLFPCPHRHPRHGLATAGIDCGRFRLPPSCFPVTLTLTCTHHATFFISRAGHGCQPPCPQRHHQGSCSHTHTIHPFLPNPIEFSLQRMPWLPLPLQVFICSVSLIIMVPVGCSIFPQIG